MAPLRVFLCCTQADRALADLLARQLHAAGADLWVGDLTTAPPEAVRQQLYTRPVFLVVLSIAALAAGHVKPLAVEASNLFQRDPTRLLLPVLAENVPASDQKSWTFLRGYRQVEAIPGAALSQDELIRHTIETLSLLPSGAPLSSLQPAQLVERGKALQAQWRYSDALPLFESAAQREPAFFDAWFNLGVTLNGLSRYPDALTVCEQQLLTLKPTDAQVWSLKAETLNNLHLFRDALPIAEQATRLDAQLSQAWVSKAQALAACDQALALNPKETQAWFAKGEIYFRQRKFREAVAIFDAGLQADPDDEELLNDKGAALQGLGLRAEAMAAYDHALRINPNHELARSNRTSVWR